MDIKEYNTSFPLLSSFYINVNGLDGAVGIATRYRLEGPGMVSGWGEIFRAVHTASLELDPASCTGVRIFPGVKVAGKFY